MRANRLTAVVVRWRGGDEVVRCLESLLHHLEPDDAHVVLVDSGSGDGGADALGRRFPQVEVVALEVNRSFAWAANQGAARHETEFVLLLNPDTEVQPNSLRPLVDFLDHNPTAAGAVPLLQGPDRRSQTSWQLRELPTPRALGWGRPGRAACIPPHPTAPIPVAQPAAAAWLVRRDAWARLGGLDPAFEPAWWEDVDFCKRLDTHLGDPAFPYDSGFWAIPGTSVVHAGGSSLEHLDDARFQEIYHRNLMRYAHRHHAGAAETIRRKLRITLVLRGLLRPRHRHAYRSARAALD